MPSPMDIGLNLLGKGEVPDRAAIQDYLTTGGANLDPVTAAWCAAFVNASLGHGGMKGTGSNMARSFLNYGTAVDQPQRGDIAVFSRGDPKGPFGHVGFFDSMNPDGTIRVLGGNQGDAVSYANFPSARLLGYRRPGGVDLPGKVGGDGAVSRDFDPQVAAAGNRPPMPTAGAPVQAAGAGQGAPEKPENGGLGAMMASLAPQMPAAPETPVGGPQIVANRGGMPAVSNAAMAADQARMLQGQFLPDIEGLLALGKRKAAVTPA